MSRKAVFFPHSDEEFEDEYSLRDWLSGSLKFDRDGIYRLREGTGLGPLEKGSIVFFVKNKLVVGLAVVEQDITQITSKHRDRYGWTSDEEKVYKKFVKFFPGSIWTFPEQQFIDTEDITNIIGKSFGQGFTMIDELDELLQVLALL